VRYYKASVVLANVILALVIVLPVWLDVLSRAEDREALQQPLESRAVLSGTTPVASTAPEAPDRTPPPPPRPDVVNTACRSHVYARCNALRIGPRDCVEVAAEAIAVPPEDGHDACLAVVEPMLAARAAARDDTPPPPPRPALTSGASAPVAPAEAASTPSPEDGAPPAEGTTETPPGSLEPVGEGAETKTKADEDTAATTGAGAESGGPEAEATETLTPRERLEKLSRMQTLIEEVQRASYNYATPPAVQAERMNELRALADDLGTEEAKALYNRMLETYRKPAIAVPIEPVVGGYVGDSARVEAGVTQRSPTTTPELETVEGWAAEARREAGLPAAEPAPGPDQAPAPTATVGSEAPAAASVESVAPSATGTVQSISP
jgi:hypothetical protein